MKIPKKIEKALQQRAYYAEKLANVSSIIDDFIIKNGLQGEIELFDYGTGCEIYACPHGSADRVREAILNHDPKKS